MSLFEEYLIKVIYLNFDHLLNSSIYLSIKSFINSIIKMTKFRDVQGNPCIMNDIAFIVIQFCVFSLSITKTGITLNYIGIMIIIFLGCHRCPYVVSRIMLTYGFLFVTLYISHQNNGCSTGFRFLT